MDVGQCNDAYGAIRIALALAELFVLLLTIRRADHVFKVQQEEAR